MIILRPMSVRSRSSIAAVAAAVAVLAAAVDPRPAAAAARAAAPDVAVTKVSARAPVVTGKPFVVVVTLTERSRLAPGLATVTVAAGANVSQPRTVTVLPGRRMRVGITMTARTARALKLAVTARVPGDRVPQNNVATATVSATDFALAPGRVLVGSFAGFGAHFNQNVYAQISRDAGVSDENALDLEQKVVGLGPQLARLFFNRNAFADADLMQSFVRAAQLAQRSGATINVTWQTSWGSNPDVEMPMFADVLADLVLKHGVSNLRWVTIQNEVNATKITMDAYDRMHRLVDERLRARGVRRAIRFMGGDLVAAKSPLGETQGDWFRFMAGRMNDVLDAYSVHIFWDYWNSPKIAKRLTEVRAIYDALPENARKPLYVSEFGVRGRRTPGDAGPGTWDDGTLLERTNVSAFQQAWFSVLASKLGYAGAIKWDGYFGRYDRVPQSYGLIGPPQEGWPLRPVYNVTRLLTSTIGPGWRTLAVDGLSGTKLVTAFASGGGALTLFGLDTAAASLNAPSPRSSSYVVGGVPPRRTFTLLYWNFDGSGTNTTAGTVTSDASGVVTVTAPLHAVFALTTLSPG